MVERITAEEARRQLELGHASLVCAYDDCDKCRRMLLDGALTLRSLVAQEARLGKDRELLFYCA